ncbi:very short patch repair endonuclease [Micromonospora sp. C41]|uniref:very short patch repair endonuclease n=1 Tax=Micromonospora sp. C41 TaxID=2824878 RepID=UPI001B3933E5|nr:very short patch repair endonuclease [Micromonospora sp. C41]MBQ1061379.1 very short patch repair endonuclease [Micromonospora sp. C41]
MDTTKIQGLKELRPSPSSAGRSRNLSAIRRTDTKPEVRLRSLLHARGLRFRKDLLVRLPLNLKARPDVAFTRARIAIFYDSCFWHSCPQHGRQPRVNQWYWSPKLARTAEWDRTQTEALRSSGWLVIRIWEHDDLLQAVDDVAKIDAARRQDLGPSRV